MRPGSLKLRLLATGAAFILLALAIAGFGLLLLFERHVERRMSQGLQAHLRQLVTGLERSAYGALDVAHPPAEPRFDQPLSGLYWQIAADSGAPVLRSRSLWDAALELPIDLLGEAEVHEHTIIGPNQSNLLVVERSITLPANLGGGRHRIAVAVDRADIHAAGLEFATDLLPALTILAAFLFAASSAQVIVGLRPLDAVWCRIHAVRSGREARLGTAFPDEVRPLAAEVDRLLDAQDAAIAQARARAANLAHGLKTPLTILASDAEELRARDETHIADEISGLIAAMRHHVERELARTRAATRAGTTASQRVRPIAEQVVSVLRRTPRGQSLCWDIDLPKALAVPLDSQDLAEIIGNLGENAVKWAASKVRIAGQEKEGAVMISMEDDGPGIPEEQVSTALTRGGRLDETQPGSGLGLAIVSDLAQAYGGAVTIGRSTIGGLKADVSIPLAARHASFATHAFTR